MKTPPEKNLKITLFVVPGTVLLLCFFSILLFSHLSIQRYLEKQTAERMEEEFRLFDDYYQGEDETAFAGSYEEDEFMVWTHFLILDEALRPVFPHEPWISEEERLRTRSISAHFRRNPFLFGKKATKITVRQKTYYLRSKQYQGILDESVILPPSSSEKGQRYTVIVYVNITPIQDFLDLLSQTLTFLLLLCASLSTLILFRTALHIDRAFFKLKKYILSVGEKVPLSAVESLTYREFNQMAQTVSDLSLRIHQAEQSQKQFFQNASHELRTPLMSIQGYAEGIHSGVLKNTKDASAVIIRESRKMSDLVDEILFLSKMDANAQTTSFQEVDLKDLLYDCSWSIQSAAANQNIRLVHRLDDQKLRIHGDEVLLGRAFSNLISNALRYANTSIEIHARSSEQAIIIQIIDDGEGIDENDLPHLFERFYKGKNGNFGIGLSITKDIITRHHGNIHAANVDHTTVFTVTLPKNIPAET